MKGKRGTDRTSRGYCGWYMNWEGTNVYLRSKQECIMACFLDHHHIHYKTEEHIYVVNDKKYKPDFFIYDKNNNLVRIIEVKYTKQDAVDYFSSYKDYFNQHNISYFVFDKGLLDKVYKRYDTIKNKVVEWINTSATMGHNVVGSKNPHYGFTHSDDSKKLIGNKTKERFMDGRYKERFKQSVKNSMTEDVRKTISLTHTGTTAKTNIVEITGECKFCGVEISGLEWYNKSTKKTMKKISMFCSKVCECSNTRKRMINDKRTKQIKLMNQYKEINGRYPLRKEFGVYCKNNNVGCDIRSTFGTHTNFIKFMEEKNG